MTSLTDRYVHAVTTQLPESQREDIARELRVSIEDAVAADPDPDPLQAERRALHELGHPTSLADSYRGEPRALIGPRLYPAWLRTLRALLTWVPLLAAGLLLFLGALDGDSPLELLGATLSALVWSALQVAFWVTLGFAIAERTGAGTSGLDALGVAEDPDDWDPDDLPEPEDRGISWGDAIGTILGNAFLLAMLLLPQRLGGEVEGIVWGQIFTDSLYALRWVLAVGVAVSLLANIVVLARRRWTLPTALVNLAGGLLFTVPIVWLAVRNDLVAWDTLPLSWIRPGQTLLVNESLTLGVTVVVLVVVLLWETVVSFRRARRG